MAKEKQKSIIEALKRAELASLDEQDRYREIIEDDSKAQSPVMKDNFIEYGWDALNTAMADCCHPPISDERLRLLKVNYDQELNRIKLEQILDKDVRFTTHFLNEIVEHTQRLRSMAKFIERVGTLQGKAGLIFGFWCNWSSYQVLHAEALEMGKQDAAEGLLQLSEATAGLIDLFLKEDLGFGDLDTVLEAV